jgi:hypothetical protein
VVRAAAAAASSSVTPTSSVMLGLLVPDTEVLGVVDDDDGEAGGYNFSPVGQHSNEMEMTLFRPLFCTERLNWAGDTPGRMRRILDETCPRGRIELTT